MKSLFFTIACALSIALPTYTITIPWDSARTRLVAVLGGSTVGMLGSAYRHWRHQSRIEKENKEKADRLRSVADLAQTIVDAHSNLALHAGLIHEEKETLVSLHNSSWITRVSPERLKDAQDENDYARDALRIYTQAEDMKWTLRNAADRIEDGFDCHEAVEKSIKCADGMIIAYDQVLKKLTIDSPYEQRELARLAVKDNPANERLLLRRAVAQKNIDHLRRLEKTIAVAEEIQAKLLPYSEALVRRSQKVVEAEEAQCAKYIERCAQADAWLSRAAENDLWA